MATSSIVDRGSASAPAAGAPIARARAIADVRLRTIVEGVMPQVDAGRFPIKRAVGDTVIVEADVFTDGHDAVRARLLHRKAGDVEWSESEMNFLANDRWQGSFSVGELGRHEYTVVGWTDRFASWLRDFARRTDPADVLLAMRTGSLLLMAAADRATAQDAEQLRQRARLWEQISDASAAHAAVTDSEIIAIVTRYPDRRLETRFDRVLAITVDSPLARCSAWYEFFPRSAGASEAAHGTFKDCEARLPYVRELGFDIVYFPPIHPIGRVQRKGPNNTLTPGPLDPGSPWAIGAKEGGHTAIHPALGTIEDFRHLVASAREQQLEIAMDIAFQCAPDHPWVEQHPEWFRFRPDGSVQYAENPPKKYQDIYPFDFETDAWAELAQALKEVVLYWAENGVRIFRVDNPHTKPFALWEELIGAVKALYPDSIFLAEAFTRPKVMHRLAKLGFTHSYTYFTWRNTKRELQEYFTELCLSPASEYFRGNVWPNTPDILPDHLQTGSRAAFMTRMVLASTLSANYGIYGPAFELLEHVPREHGSEEYRDSEKYQIRRWDLQRSDTLAPFIKRLNEIRRGHKVLQRDSSLRWLNVDNDQLLAYAKVLAEEDDVLVVVVNLDAFNVQTGWLELPLTELRVDPLAPYRMDDLLGGDSYQWQGATNFVRLDPNGLAAHVFRIRRHGRTEQQFDYFT
jgi:starch synthase (maltosyl-transferring)